MKVYLVGEQKSRPIWLGSKNQGLFEKNLIRKNLRLSRMQKILDLFIHRKITGLLGKKQGLNMKNSKPTKKRKIKTNIMLVNHGLRSQSINECKSCRNFAIDMKIRQPSNCEQ